MSEYTLDMKYLVGAVLACVKRDAHKGNRTLAGAGAPAVRAHQLTSRVSTAEFSRNSRRIYLGYDQHAGHIHQTVCLGQGLSRSTQAQLLRHDTEAQRHTMTT